MDAQRFKDAWERLDLLDSRLTHRVRPRPGGGLMRPSTEQLEVELRDLAAYTVELKDVLRDLFAAIGAPSPAAGPERR
jgi:hypothetical protein